MPQDPVALNIRRRLRDDHSGSRLRAGDLVKRRYELRLPDVQLLGVVLERDRNGFLTVVWGDKVEHMWDDYDLMGVEGDR